MGSPSKAGRAFGALLALGLASVALLLALLWRQSEQLAQGIWLACQNAIQAVTGYWPLLGLLLPMALLLGAGLRSLTMLISQLWYTRRLTRDLAQRSLPLPQGLADLVDSLHLAGRVTLVEDAEAYAFAAGLARARIWLSSGLLVLLDEAELAAVLRHERHHLQRRDPLRVLLVRSLAHGLFFLPAASALRDLYMEAKEREADAASDASCELAAALLKLLRAGSHLPARAGLAAAQSGAAVDRIHRLLGNEPASRAIDWSLARRLAASLTLAAALWIASTASLTQAGSPLEGDRCGYTAWPATQERAITPATFTPHDLAGSR